MEQPRGRPGPRVEGTPTPVREHNTSIVKNGVKVQSITHSRQRVFGG